MAALRELLTYEPNELKFGTSGLRGLVTDMTDLECYINTVGFLRFLVQVGELKPAGRVLLAGDLRDSTPRIMAAAATAVADEGFELEYCGLIPTPAVSYYGFVNGYPSIMVTGSHIPADRNGIKFVKPHDEVLKEDEAAIKAAVAKVRAKLYDEEAARSRFDERGGLRNPAELPDARPEATRLYRERYLGVFGPETLAGKKLVFYQHSAVGRDLLVELFEALGAEVVKVGRSDTFIPIDSENVTAKDEVYFKKLAQENPGLFAIVSTDGDSDRPFCIDAEGVFHRGDVLGAVVADWLGADFAAYPVSTSDAVDEHLKNAGVEFKHTRIGSPYVIAAMKQGVAEGKQRVVSWEVNGGFLVGSDLAVNGRKLRPLPTRDAFFPILVALLSAAQAKQSVKELFAGLPQRFTQAGLIDNFPVRVSQQILKTFGDEKAETKARLHEFFTGSRGFSDIRSIDTLDGVRIVFENGDIAHLRPSGNAPQLRIYSVADSQTRADEIVTTAIREPDGIFREMERALKIQA